MEEGYVIISKMLYTNFVSDSVKLIQLNEKIEKINKCIDRKNMEIRKLQYTNRKLKQQLINNKHNETISADVLTKDAQVNKIVCLNFLIVVQPILSSNFLLLKMCS